MRTLGDQFGQQFPELFSGVLATPQERAAADVIRRAMRGPGAPAFPERRAWPITPLPSVRLYSRAWWRALGQLLRRAFIVPVVMEGRPCCLGYRYGHGWTQGRYVQLTQHGGGLQVRDVEPWPDWLEVGIEKTRRSGGLGTVVVDYRLVLQGPPAPCPTCGCKPPERELARWLAHVAKARTR